MSIPINANATNNFGVAQLIVDAIPGKGTHTSIANSLTTAVAGQTIFIRPGTYTENLTLKAGVNLTAFGCDSSLNGTGNVIINGNCTFSSAGSVSISGIQLQTNVGNCLTVSGSAASIVNLNNCYINATNNTAISFSSSSSSSAINLSQCNGNIVTTGITLFSHSSAGTMNMYSSNFLNTGLSTTAATISGSGSLFMFGSLIESTITTSSTSMIQAYYSAFATAVINTICLTIGGTGNNHISNSLLSSGTATAATVGTGATLNIYNCDINSENSTSVISGAGTLEYGGISQSFAPAPITTATQSNSGTLPGGRNGNAPSAGFLGERISSAVVGSGAITGVAQNLTSISLTPGIWDITVLFVANSSAGACQSASAGPSTVSGSLQGNSGDQYATTSLGSNGIAYAITVSVPNFRATLSANTKYYLVGVNYSLTGVLTVDGRISAVRVG